MRKSKVFIGPLNTANFALGLTKSLRSIGIIADYWSWSVSKHPFGYNKDKTMFLFDSSPPFLLFGKNLFYFANIFLRYYYLFKMIFLYNTFLFISPDTILKKNKDLPFLKFFRKKIIFAFMGCNERDPEFEKNSDDWVCNNCKDENKKIMCLCNDIPQKRSKVHKMEFYSDFILSQADCASYLQRKKAVWPYIFCEAPPQIDITEKVKDNKLKIIHFPSNSLAKQSHKIVPVLHRIQSERDDVEVVIKSGIPHTEVLEELKTSHILIDQLGSGYGVLGLEAMLRGCVVLNRDSSWFSGIVYDSPIFYTSAKTLYNDINALLENRELLKSYLIKSTQFYKDYHSIQVLGQYYKDNLNL